MTESMKKVRGWFDDFMRKATDDKNQILENMDGLVDRIKNLECWRKQSKSRNCLRFFKNLFYHVTYTILFMK